MDETINEIIFLYWSGQSSSEEMQQRLAELPVAKLVSWIDDMVNHTSSMNPAIPNCRMKYHDRLITVQNLPMDDRIEKAAQCYCLDGSVRYWRSDSSMRAVMDGFCQLHEYDAFEKRANELKNQL